jgi:hypothetical protein
MNGLLAATKRSSWAPVFAFRTPGGSTELSEDFSTSPDIRNDKVSALEIKQPYVLRPPEGFWHIRQYTTWPQKFDWRGKSWDITFGLSVPMTASDLKLSYKSGEVVIVLMFVHRFLNDGIFTGYNIRAAFLILRKCDGGADVAWERIGFSELRCIWFWKRREIWWKDLWSRMMAGDKNDIGEYLVQELPVDRLPETVSIL